MDGWVLYRELRFDLNGQDLKASEKAKLADVATYLKANPSLAVGIDGAVDPANEKYNKATVDARIQAVRNELLDAGVAEDNIRTGAFRNTRASRAGEVAILIRTKK